jgi:type II secretory pathway pseudopilin PulG
MRSEAPDAEAGFTLVELLVSAIVLGAVLLLFGAGMVQMYRAAGKAEALNVAQAQLQVAFQRLDGKVRYASAVSEPGRAGAASYVEFLTTSAGPAVCTQLRFDTALVSRSWTVGEDPADTWTTWASGLTATSEPFTLTRADQDESGRQRLTVAVVAGSGGAANLAARESRVTVTALNSSVDSPPPTRCTEHRPTS